MAALFTKTPILKSSYRGNKTLSAVAEEGIIQLLLNKYIVPRIQSHKINEHFAFLNFYIEWESNFRVYSFPVF